MNSSWNSLAIAFLLLLPTPRAWGEEGINPNSSTSREQDLPALADSETPEPPSIVIEVEEEPVNPENEENPEPESHSSPDEEENPSVEPLDYEILGFSEADIARYEQLAAADRLYLDGEMAAAERLYRSVKEPFEAETQPIPEEIAAPQTLSDPAELPPDGAVFWRQSTSGLELGLYTKIFVPLEMLVDRYPHFLPGQVRYIQALQTYDRGDEASQRLQELTERYPNDPDVLLLQIAAQQEQQEWLEASFAARQYAMMNPDSPRYPEFLAVADENFDRYQEQLRSRIRGNAILNAITGILGYAFLGDLFGPISAVDATILMLQGESAVGDRIAAQIQDRAPLIEDESVLAYVREVGEKLAILGGRDEFDYEFYVILDDSLNAFALPGGKVFIHAGAIAKTNSEAELAGLLSHELAHAILSHGFQLVTQGNLTTNITQFIPFVGGTAGTLLTLDYSRDMERQADILGTRMLATGGYAADGLRNLMVTLGAEYEGFDPPAWLSTHPGTTERISYLEELILTNGYNRYAFEGVENHQRVRQRVIEILNEYQAEED